MVQAATKGQRASLGARRERDREGETIGLNAGKQEHFFEEGHGLPGLRASRPHSSHGIPRDQIPSGHFLEHLGGIISESAPRAACEHQIPVQWVKKPLGNFFEQ